MNTPPHVAPRRSLLIVCLTAAIALGLGAPPLFTLWQLTQHYPSAHPLDELSGVKLTTTGLGRCLAIDLSLTTGDGVDDVTDWYAHNGWKEITPLTPNWRFGRLALGRFYLAQGSRSGPTHIFQRQAYCLS